MGEAKRRKEALRKVMVDELRALAAPPSEAEQKLASILMGLSAKQAYRESAEKLAWAKMKPRECHANVSFYVNADPSKQATHVVGWWKQAHQFVLHSVIGMGPNLVCITPQQRGVPETFLFAPDPEITWADEGEGVRRFYRDGILVPKIVRTDPAAATGVATIGLERLAHGMDPARVWDLIDDEMGRRFSR
ncbi:hypothetical protein GR702_05415 [Novosphingobium sp. FGD1]|uniref:Uncharacterized protein n=1 Tax=Novosphingobium silvae TaxID=2692619 RepID=A0A7X4K6I6_9SPHN|nr:hypothetical protein [Novosphingobium silvae]MYL97209.1 hypothetical protein [Novosphingobium silvae]